MFSKKQRINKKLFEDVFAFGKTIKTKYFILKYTENNEELCRVSVVASKKIFKTAVSRNKIKRKFRSVLNENNVYKNNKNLIFILNKTVELAKKEDVGLIISQLRLK